MKERIKAVCEELEKEHNIRILFAIENGSRAWRMESEDSDYDVRFVYVRPVEDYLRIRKKADVIQIAFDEEGNRMGAEGSFIDCSGFDVFKFLTLLAGSNPTCIEWLTTDIVYHGKQNLVFKKFAQEEFNPIALYFHYKSLSKSNFRKYISSQNDVTHKRYLYTFRGLVNAKWVLHKGSIPPINFIETMKQMEGVIPEDVLESLKEIIELKKTGKEKDKIENITHLDIYVEDFLADEEVPMERKPKDVEVLDKELRKIILAKQS